jgi:dTDP-4-amino-4,6-dideoxygalactose transaminase
VHSGAVPLLVDIDPNDLQMSFDHFARAHDRFRFKAAVLPHLYGWCSSRLHDFRVFCADRGIILIEDGAQAFGVQYENQSVFAGADTITLSFSCAKVIGGIMDGGAVLVNSSKRTADTIRLLANHGRTGHYEHALVGWNSRMSEINAAWLCRAIGRVGEIISNRRGLLRDYHALHATMFSPPDITDNGYLALTTCGVPTVDTKKLAALGVGSARIYPSPISAQPGADRALRFGDLENSVDFCTHVINLPLYYGMDPKHVETAAHALKEVLRG